MVRLDVRWDRQVLLTESRWFRWGQLAGQTLLVCQRSVQPQSKIRGEDEQRPLWGLAGWPGRCSQPLQLAVSAVRQFCGTYLTETTQVLCGRFCLWRLFWMWFIRTLSSQDIVEGEYETFEFGRRFCVSLNPWHLLSSLWVGGLPLSFLVHVNQISVVYRTVFVCFLVPLWRERDSLCG